MLIHLVCDVNFVYVRMINQVPSESKQASNNHKWEKRYTAHKLVSKKKFNVSAHTFDWNNEASTIDNVVKDVRVHARLNI